MFHAVDAANHEGCVAIEPAQFGKRRWQLEAAVQGETEVFVLGMPVEGIAGRFQITCGWCPPGWNAPASVTQ